ncbi:hypothetical protein KY334_01030 [Candidatus Woesearchaeota archaeon]|nr:hypothetical protein [Candidatus Woesearchaeota archaeon]
MNLEYLSKVKIKGITDPEQRRCWAKELTQILEKSEPFIKTFCRMNDAEFLNLEYKLNNLQSTYVFKIGRTIIKYNYEDLKKELETYPSEN